MSLRLRYWCPVKQEVGLHGGSVGVLAHVEAPGLDDRAVGQTISRCFNAAIRQLREASPKRMDAGDAYLDAAMREGDRVRSRY